MKVIEVKNSENWFAFGIQMLLVVTGTLSILAATASGVLRLFETVGLGFLGFEAAGLVAVPIWFVPGSSRYLRESREYSAAQAERRLDVSPPRGVYRSDFYLGAIFALWGAVAEWGELGLLVLFGASAVIYAVLKISKF